MIEQVTGFVGIFWGISQPDRSWTLITDATSLADAEPYGDFLTHPRGHFEVWSQWQTQGTKALTVQGIPPEIVHHEYEDYPRGRIVFDTVKKSFILYADRRLQRPDLIARIAAIFALKSGTFVVRSDEHYRS